MVKCDACGKLNQDNLQFCVYCGEKIIKNTYNKCPSCGNTLTPFETRCSYCNMEVNFEQNKSEVRIFTERLNELEKQRSTYHHKNMSKDNKDKLSALDKQKIELIKNYIIPNTKQDIYEFMILSITNFDADYYAKHLDEEDVSDAWLIKIEQCIQKAELVLENNDREKILELYNKIKPTIETAKKLKKEEEIKAKKKEESKKFKKSGTHVFLIFSIVISLIFFLSAIGNEHLFALIISVISITCIIIVMLMGYQVIKKNSLLYVLLIITSVVLNVIYIIVLNN